MYPHLIELNDSEYKHPITINIDAINYIGLSDKSQDTKIVLGNTFKLVEESYDEVKKLIFDAGCIIAKADPRLDNRPLTMEDLKGMIGEPIWNSNLRQWQLVISKNFGGNNVIDCCNSLGVVYTYTQDDLLKFPLYRMKREEKNIIPPHLKEME